jgi:5-hmdU DNA kinase-like protein
MGQPFTQPRINSRNGLRIQKPNKQLTNGAKRPSPRLSFMLLSSSNRYFYNLQFPNNLQPTVVFASCVWLGVERYAIYLRRLKGEPQPWTDDSILQAHKFTNTFRVLDRVSQYLLKEIIYRPGVPMETEEIVFRILLFKLFNSILAWKVLLQNFGMPTWAEFDEKAYAKVLGDAWKEGKGVRIWNPAYVQNQNYRTDLPTKHERYLALVKYMMDDQVADRLQGSQTYEQAYRVLRNYPLHGQRFLPMQHLTDINYSPVLNFDEDDFITPGDGAMRGTRNASVVGSPFRRHKASYTTSSMNRKSISNGWDTSR